MRALFSSLSGRGSVGSQLGLTLGGTFLCYLLLELWRPCYFLTDDNLTSGFPVLTEMGRALKAGHLPFTSIYLFGGGYSYLHDLNSLLWHPFYLLPAMLADTSARFWIMDLAALLFLLLSAAGFALLGRALREEFALEISDGYLIFYTLSFVFSTYILTVGPSWLNFLGNQSALPWLALGIMERRPIRAVLLVLVFSLHELLSGYPPLALTGGLGLTLFSCGVGWARRSAQPPLYWVAGNALACIVALPLLMKVLDGFAHSARHGDFQLWVLNRFSVPANTFAFSFLLGNWSEPITRLHGDIHLVSLGFPYLSTILCCAAAWCALPALLVPARWRPMDFTCAAIIGLVGLFVIRPHWLAIFLYHLPFFHSQRWPFREGMLFLFFVHVFLVLRFPAGIRRLQPAVTLFSFLMFVLPLPFIRPPTLDPFALDRNLLFSGQAETYWARITAAGLLKPGDQIFTVMGWGLWGPETPFTLLGTYNFPAYLQIHSISGYSPTSPIDQLPLKTPPDFWFGAYTEKNMARVFRERPDLKMVRIESVEPLKITLTDSSGKVTDLTPYLNAAGIVSPAPVSPAAR